MSVLKPNCSTVFYFLDLDLTPLETALVGLEYMYLMKCLLPAFQASADSGSDDASTQEANAMQTKHMSECCSADKTPTRTRGNIELIFATLIFSPAMITWSVNCSHDPLLLKCLKGNSSHRGNNNTALLALGRQFPPIRPSGPDAAFVLEADFTEWQ